MLKTSGGFWCTCGEWNVERTEKRAPSVRVLFHRLRSPFSCPLRWPDVGFVCPVSVSCVFARAQLKQTLCQDFLVFVCVYGVYMRPKYIYTDIFLFLFSPKLPVTDTKTSSFVNQQICLCIFQCFWDKNMLHIVSSILACVCTVIWYNTLYSCFVFLGISIFQTIPSFSNGCLTINT